MRDKRNAIFQVYLQKPLLKFTPSKDAVIRRRDP